jgi:PilZ domain
MVEKVPRAAFRFPSDRASRRRSIPLASEADNNPSEPSEKRAEPRYPTDDIVAVNVPQDPKSSQHAKVCNISRSGLQLELKTAIPAGHTIEIITARRNLALVGEIRYCVESHGGFRAGVLIRDTVLPTAAAEQHADADQLATYLSGQGLATADFFRIKKHLETCNDCRGRLSGTLESTRE